MKEFPGQSFPDRTENNKPSVSIALVGNDFMIDHWEEVEVILTEAFADSTYLDEGYGPNNPITYTRAGVRGELGEMGHAVALGSSGEIMGGILCIPTQRQPHEKDCDVGWVFITPDVPFRTRLEVMDGLMGQVVGALTKAGFQRVVTNMGTVAGADSLGRRYGIVHEPTAEKPNRWVKDLKR